MYVCIHYLKAQPRIRHLEAYSFALSQEAAATAAAAAEARGATKILGYHNKNFYQVTKREHSHEDPISFDSS